MFDGQLPVTILQRQDTQNGVSAIDDIVVICGLVAAVERREPAVTGDMGERLFRVFPEKHPFHFARSQMRPSEEDKDKVALRGYVSAPIDGVFLRAPYLHNASVLTLAELINLKARRATFTRGDDLYDPGDVGFNPSTVQTSDRYFEFDSTLRGNSNRGHDYPWAYDDPRRNVDDLSALIDVMPWS